MIGVWSDEAQNFLLVSATLAALFFAIPLFFMPLRWASMLLWRIPADSGLAFYFGRCLGAFGLVLVCLMFRAGLYETGIGFTFEIMIMVWVLMVVVHVWGWLQGIQPVTETFEIGFWLLLIALTLAFWPSVASS